MMTTSFNIAGAILQGSNSLNLTYDDQHQRIMQVNTVSGTATTTTVYLNDPASGAMSEQVTNAGTTPTVWNSFNWGGKPWGGVTADAIPTWVDYIQVDGQIVAQRSVKYQAGDLWGQQNWGSFSWGTPAAGSNWGAFNWGSGTWTGPVVVWEYFTLDHLNSVAVVTDQGGNVLQRLSYDPWGKARNANGTDAACGAITPDTTRGFTNQEQMPTACLVNLNARLYDPSIGKFLGPDPVIGDPFAPNAFNRYAYVLNNPLSFTDPFGLCFLGCFWNSPIFRDIAAIAVVVVFQQYEVLPSVLGEGAAFAASNLGMVVNGAILGGVTGGISGGNLKSVGLGMLQGGLFAGAGNVLQGETQALSDNAEMGAWGMSDLSSPASTTLGSVTADTFVAHGLVGGITSVASGGSFGSGFLAGGVGSLADNPGLDTSTFAGNVAEHAIAGGLGAELGGGKFANGAETGAFGYLYNYCLHNNCFGSQTLSAESMATTALNPYEAQTIKTGIEYDVTVEKYDPLTGFVRSWFGLSDLYVSAIHAGSGVSMGGGISESNDVIAIDAATVVAAHTHPWADIPSQTDITSFEESFRPGQELLVIGPTATTVIMQTPDGSVQRTIRGPAQRGYPSR